MKTVIWLALILAIPLVAVGQDLTPMPDTIGSGGATATDECSQLTLQIGAKRTAIAMVTARIAASKAAGDAAEREFIIAAGYAVTEPWMATWWNMMAAYHFGRLLYWADAVNADMFLRRNLEIELDDLLQAYALAGC